MGMPIGTSQSNELPHPTKVNELYMLKGEVPWDAYLEFIAQNPSWHPDNRGELINQQLVDDQYLKIYDEAPQGDSPVTHVSYFAAVAFTEWFGASLPPAWSGFAVRLPTEAEWEWAAKFYSTEEEAAGDFHGQGPTEVQGKQGVEALMGSLWEWCDTWYQPASYFLSSWSPVSKRDFNLPGVEAVVRGGSWANRVEDRINPATRGSQPPEWCTPFTGFRIIMVRK